MAWIFVLLAVCGNILSNVMFKNAMEQAPDELSAGALFGFAFNPYLWAGGFAAVCMLGCYLLALREGGLSVSYATVTSLSLVGITVISALMLREPLSWQSIAGVALVLGGIMMISVGTANTEAAEVPAVAQPAE